MKKIFIYTALIFAGVVLSTGCRKDFEKINTNPATYNQSNFDPNYLLTSAQLGYSGSSDFSYDTWRGNLIYCSTMIQGLSTVISYWAGDKYILNSGYTAAYWGFSGNTPTAGDGAYPEQVRPIVDVVQSTTGKAGYKNLHQIARIMKALIFERITDLYGDVPYSQAGIGYYEKNYFPVYDKQQAIYTDLLKEISDATTQLDPAADKPTGDKYYNGDIAKWKKFGNTLLLRVAMRLSKVDPVTAKTYVQKAIGNTMASNADDAFFMGDASGGRNTINRNSQILLGDGGQENYYTRWSKTFIDFLKTNNDPRLSKVAVTNLYIDENTKTQNPAANSTAAVQKGMPNGKDLSGIAAQDIRQDPSFTAFPDYSSPSPNLIKRGGPTFVLTYAESELLWADAAERFGLGGSAAQHYHDGVVASMTYLGEYDPAAAVTITDAELYMLAHPYVSANGLQMINTQYWALTNTMLDFYESWSNWRRSGYPLLVPVNYPGNNTGGTIPRRFPYPITEAGTNTANYNAAHNAVVGGDVLTSRVWWDSN
ncbi:SusD/RagB family nutrient-binding outer membrane lipoprotein [Mucilaginibacter sp. UR6-11]|uniref:SusD/RagB family nutrient-binding outer membrane lipoprotein n=1 Tax=Mucilaginibacter sp. UR6-11 TaxID=1435644 RepID=UPI001E5719E4|nr:SusD/RagB family nutrient-binding outer membrane lipoprotein [Mucilaginibacter sp. UR6-11]MCC8424902.1 SusD/RagB family nutrient-binding outer membrane lipoprotein [Mucilaginibacter sp. UR6-11]